MCRKKEGSRRINQTEGKQEETKGRYNNIVKT
jgi:hypothetical protein